MNSSNDFQGKAVIISAPSGAGKTTLVNKLLKAKLPLLFSISACSRAPREGEEDKKDYYFLLGKPQSIGEREGEDPSKKWSIDLEHLYKVNLGNQETYLMVLLIDERP